MTDKGQLSTDIVTYIVPLLFVINTYITANPGPLEAYIGVWWTGLAIALFGAFLLNFKNPRTVETEE